MNMSVFGHVSRGTLLLAVIGALGQRAQAELLVSSRTTGAVLKYDELTGAPLGAFISAGSGGLVQPVGVRRGPDGHIYVTDQATNKILKYNGATGAYIGAFVSTQLDQPTDLRFGSDGNLYVANFGSGKVQQFNASTGAFIKTFASAPDGVFSSLQFGPDNNLYVSDFNNNAILKFNGTTGTLLSSFGEVNLAGPGGLLFGPNNQLFVSSIFDSRIVRFNATTGAFLGTLYDGADDLFISGLLINRQGQLLAGTLGGNSVLRLQLDPPQYLGLAASGGGLELPAQLLILTPGDANGDSRVDGADYVLWANRYKKSGNPAQGDFDGNGVVDGADYIVWANRYTGSNVPPVYSAAMPVPEPLTLALLVVGLITWGAFACCARRHR
jgi:outer membrane protein assembly factor BamB